MFQSLPVGHHVGDVLHRIEQRLVVLPDEAVELRLAPVQLPAQRAAVEHRQAERRSRAEDAIGGLEQLRQAERLEAGERGEVDVRVEVRLRRLDVVRGRLHLRARRHHIGAPPEQVRRQARGQHDIGGRLQLRARERLAAIGAGADQIRQLVARERDARLDDRQARRA